MGDGSRDFWVGLFVLGSLIAGIALLLQLGDGSGREDPDRYRLVFSRDVSGLTVGAEVTYLGVTVGQVNRIGLLNGKPPAVEVLIDVGSGTPVTRASFASLAYHGVTGIAVINLADDPEVEAVALARSGDGPVTLPTRDTGIAAVLARGPELSSRLQELLSRGNSLMGDDNLRRFETLLDNLTRSSDAIAAQQSSIAALPEEMRALVAQTQSVIQRVDTLTAAMAPDLQSTGAQLNGASADLAQMAEQLRELLQRHENTLDEALSDGLAEFPALVSEARDTLTAVESLVAGLERNPSQVLYRARQDQVVLQP